MLQSVVSDMIAQHPEAIQRVVHIARVIGWTIADFHSGHVMLLKPNGQVVSTSRWRPDLHTVDAFEAIDAAHIKYGCQISVHVFPKSIYNDNARYACEISQGELSYSSSALRAIFYGPTRERAIARAIAAIDPTPWSEEWEGETLAGLGSVGWSQSPHSPDQ